ncbi:MAG: hypothetical protein MK289_16745 [Trichodesmium sp. ALOHA_ZT_67]|nr:hypothetical protein [Trichodesmium erythraeum GBRTRLIN201]MCH2050069.1 hypothetical protein [Trichodesmium sp. ALOHA_ZT_67]MDE5094070.1 hypothetical protein [Trichodesmium sp. St11_bin5]MDT9341536.1 hypothetical protein [Trichodesmium erythraeum 21-75]
MTPSTHSYLQPAEGLWPLIDELIANYSFAGPEELEAVLFEGCQLL